MYTPQDIERLRDISPLAFGIFQQPRCVIHVPRDALVWLRDEIVLEALVSVGVTGSEVNPFGVLLEDVIDIINAELFSREGDPSDA